MAKKKEAVNVFSGSIRDDLASMLGMSTVDTSSFNVFTGVEIPSIAFQWLIGSNVFPMERIYELAGKAGARKSTFMFELMRWHLDAGGAVVLIETEGKDSASIRHAVWKYDMDAIKNRTLLVEETILESWLEKLYKLLDTFKKQYSSVPVIIAVDSMAASSTRSMQEEIDKDGLTEAKYPAFAKQLSHNLRNFPARLKGFPVVFVFTNHYKEAIGGGFGEQGTRPGGSALQFAESCSIRFTKSAARAPKHIGSFAVWLKLDTLKPMMTENRNIDVLVHYDDEENPNHNPNNPLSSSTRKAIGFDWGTTDIAFLDGIITDSSGRYNYDAARRKQIKEITGLGFERSKQMAWSEKLGVPESEKVHASVLGKKLMENTAMVAELQNALGISKSLPFFNGMDFKDTLVDITQTLESTVSAPPIIIPDDDSGDDEPFFPDEVD